MAEARGFQTLSRDSSRGQFPPRSRACVALPPRAPDENLATPCPRQGAHIAHPCGSVGGGTPRGTFERRVAAGMALANTRDSKGWNPVLRLTRRAWQQIEQ